MALGIAASDDWKNWGVANFVALSRALLSGGWHSVVLVGGPAEQGMADAIQSALGEQAGQAAMALGWNLRELAALLAGTALYVGNDTAALNIAAAVGTRSYGLFGATPVLRHSPSIVPIVPPGGPDRAGGMARITVEMVIAAIAPR